MLYHDFVYGKQNIENKIILEILNTDPMGRLRGINQLGPFIFLKKDILPFDASTTRFDHSVGTFLLVKTFNGSLEEQIAALLHDISHTVFSHTCDFVFGSGIEHTYHEKIRDKIIDNSNLKDILIKNNINPEYVFDESRYRILERELPDICADRLDYFLRDALKAKIIAREDVSKILKSLILFNGELVFSDENIAKFFAEKYIISDKNIWSSLFFNFILKVGGEIVRIALSKGILKEDDLLLTDKIVYEKILLPNDNEIIKLIEVLQKVNKVKITNESDYDYHLKTKIRCTDPKVLVDGKTVRLSFIDEQYKVIRENHIKEKRKGYYVKVE